MVIAEYQPRRRLDWDNRPVRATPQHRGKTTMSDQVFELNLPLFEIAFSVPWPKVGQLNVVHSLRRPTPGEEQEYKRQSMLKSKVTTEGKRFDEQINIAGASIDLWNKIAKSVSGYPLNDGAETAITDDIRARLLPAHKELAIAGLFASSAEVLMDESELSWDGSGVWAVKLSLGDDLTPYAVLHLKLKYWDERQKTAFERDARIGDSAIEGKVRKESTGVNAATFSNLFDALLADVTVDPLGPHQSVKVDGKTFAEAGAGAFAAAFLREWKIDVISALIQIWRGKASASVMN